MALNDDSYFQGTYKDLHFPALIIAGSFAFIALVVSILLIFQHLRSYTNPVEQKWIVAVVFMVPVYASESIISLLNSQLSLACDILRNCYEAFALYAFGSYLVACLGGEDRVVRLLESDETKQLTKPLVEGSDKKHALNGRSFRHFFCEPNVMGRNMFTVVKFGLVQYMILKTFCAFLSLLLEIFGVYGDGEFKWYYGYPYITVVINFSQMWALFCLVQFYHVTYERLLPIKPLAKFISFKAIVFATWWQGVGIALLCAIHVLPKEGKFQTGLQDFLICIEQHFLGPNFSSHASLDSNLVGAWPNGQVLETASPVLGMFIAAVAHIYVFSAKPYHYFPISEHGKIVLQETKARIILGDDSKEKSAMVEKVGTHVEAPGTSVKESVQDIVMGGGESVAKDVALTINQAIDPVGKGMTKIQEKIHHVTVDSKDKEEHLDVEEHVEIEEHGEKGATEGDSHVVSFEEKVVAHYESDK